MKLKLCSTVALIKGAIKKCTVIMIDSPLKGNVAVASSKTIGLLPPARQSDFFRFSINKRSDDIVPLAVSSRRVGLKSRLPPLIGGRPNGSGRKQEVTRVASLPSDWVLL